MNRIFKHTGQILVLLAGQLAWGQTPGSGVQIGENLHLKASGTFTAGYAADYGDQIQSSHSLDLGASGSITGNYYDPNFANFTVSPYYGQSHANSDSQSLSSSSGVTAVVNLFSGTHFPGSVSYGLSKDSTGTYGMVGAPNFTTKGNGQDFGIGWGAAVPGWPSLGVAYSRGTGSGTVYGTNAKNSSTSQSFQLNSAYTWLGFPLRVFYNHIGVNSSTPNFLSSAQETDTSNASGNNYGISTSHKLPLNGSFAVSYDRSSSTSTYNYGVTEGRGTSNYVTSMENSSGNFRPTREFNVYFSESYTDNLAGALVQSVTSTGTIVPGVDLGTGSKSFDVSGGASYQIAHSMSASVLATRVTQFYNGTSYSASFASATFDYGARLLKMFTFSASLLEESQFQNNSIGYMATVNYSRRYGGWDTSGNFSYTGNAQTMLVTYTSSSMGYGAHLSRSLTRRTKWSLGFGGGHSGLSNVQPSPSNNSWNASTSLSGRRYSFFGNYGSFSGSSIMSGSGLVLVQPTPGLPSNDLTGFSGTNYGAGAAATPFRNLSIAAAYSRSLSNTFNGGTNSNNNTETFSSQLQYHFRRISLLSGYTWLNQGISAAGSSSTGVSSYFVGVSRWFDFF